MIARGAKGTEEEFSLILDYLTVQYGPPIPGPRTCDGGGSAGGRTRTGSGIFARARG